MEIKIKRIYDAWSEDDGLRILVDRMWPRGISKAKGKIDLWLKKIAPSPELCKWFGHEADKWEDFKSRYAHELSTSPETKEALEEFKAVTRGQKRVTLLYAARDEEHNNALFLLSVLRESKL